MKKMNVMALFIGAALFTGLGATSAMAKCGDSSAPAATKCGGDKAATKCGAEKPVPPKPKGKCGAGKCG